ncbi:MAG: cytochrome P450 [Solirubrobacteraceae bacterium]
MTETTPTAAPPELAGYDPFEPGHLRDPYPMYHRALRECPVFYYEPLRFWMVTRYDDVEAVLRDVSTFASRVWRVVPRPAQFADRLPSNLMANAFINLDPPEHTVSRKAANRAFTRGLIAGLEPAIESIANELIDGFADAGRCDLMQDFALPLSLRTIVHVLGLPEEDMPKFRQWTEDMFSLMSPAAPGDESTAKPMGEDEVVARYERIADAYAYYGAVVRERRERPGQDPITGMVQARAEDGSPAMAADRIIVHMLELTAAGHDTTANTIANLVQFFDRWPAERERLRSSLLASAVEECLRLRAASPTMFRLTTREVTLSGVTIPANAVVCVNLGAANHDPAHFPDPAAFCIDRENATSHLAFGKGRHFCLGAPLARLETIVALRSLHQRLGAIAVVPGQDQVFLPVVTLDSRLHLEVTWAVS